MLECFFLDPADSLFADPKGENGINAVIERSCSDATVAHLFSFATPQQFLPGFPPQPMKRSTVDKTACGYSGLATVTSTMGNVRSVLESVFASLPSAARPFATSEYGFPCMRPTLASGTVTLVRSSKKSVPASGLVSSRSLIPCSCAPKHSNRYSLTEIGSSSPMAKSPGACLHGE